MFATKIDCLIKRSCLPWALFTNVPLPWTFRGFTLLVDQGQPGQPQCCWISAGTQALQRVTWTKKKWNQSSARHLQRNSPRSACHTCTRLDVRWDGWMRRFQGESIVLQLRWLIFSSRGAALTADLWHHAAVSNQGHLHTQKKHGCTMNQTHGAAFIFFLHWISQIFQVSGSACGVRMRRNMDRRRILIGGARKAVASKVSESVPLLWKKHELGKVRRNNTLEYGEENNEWNVLWRTL